MRRAALGVAVLVALASAACVRDELVTCDDVLCPVGSMCTPRGCASPDELAACAGMEENAACGVDVPGRCHDGFCDLARCGNSIVDDNEHCDDGNSIGGDGCSALCTSDETCGNGVVDVAVGEQCDEGITALSGDGCTSACSIEFGTWQLQAPASLGARDIPLMARAAGRRPGVLLVGSGVADTWLYTEGRWELIPTRTRPPAAFNGALVYDSERDRTVRITAGGDIWEFDGEDWTQVVPTSPATPPVISRAAYDAARHEIVAYTPGADTWILTGTTWRMHVGAGPRVTQPVLEYLPARESVILFGGIGSADGRPQNHTWEWDGARWTDLGTLNEPPARVRAASAIDRNGRLVVAGGEDLSVGVPAAWTYDGLLWYPGALGPDVVSAAMAVEPSTGAAVLYGGHSPSAGMPVNTSTWSWNGAGWTVQARAVYTNACSMLASVTGHGRVVQLGVASRWSWNGIQWLPGAPLDIACDARATYDPIVDRIILHDGATIEIDAATELVAAITQLEASPPRRRGAAFATDPLDGTTLMFGGQQYGGDGLLYGDTWRFSRDVNHAGRWEELALAPTEVPVPRRLAGLAWDSIAHRLVLFGGLNAREQPLNDTWEWRGAGWVELSPDARPPASGPAAMVNGPRGRPLLVVGGPMTSTWELQRSGAAVTWRELRSVVPLPTLAALALGYDGVNASAVLSTANAFGPQTWTFAFRSPDVPRDACIDTDTDADGLVGCADPDCQGRCMPLCPPYDPEVCRPGPHCGDGTCSRLEDSKLCPDDCAPP